MLIVATAEVRDFAAAAVVQGFRVAALTLTAPFRARLLDRVGRSRVILPQTALWTVALAALAILLIVCELAYLDRRRGSHWNGTGQPLPGRRHPHPLADRRRTGAEVKALHSYDSILEEAGFLIGPLLASVLMLGFGPRSALYVVAAGVIAGGVLALLPAEIRAALRQ